MASCHLEFAHLRGLLAIAVELQGDRRHFLPKLETLLTDIGALVGAASAGAYEVAYLSRGRHGAKPLTELSIGGGGPLQRSALVGIAGTRFDLHVLDRATRVTTGWGAPSWLEASGPCHPGWHPDRGAP